MSISDIFTLASLAFSSDHYTSEGTFVTEQAKKRAIEVETSGLVDVKKSGEVYVNWNRAVRSSLLKEQIESIDTILFAEEED